MHTCWCGHRGVTWEVPGRKRGNSQLVKHKQAEAGEYYSADRDAKKAICPSCKKEDRHRQLINAAIQYNLIM